MNNPDLAPAPGSWLAGFAARTGSLDGFERASCLENDTELDSAHAEAGARGQSAVPDADDEVNLHFICFVHVDGGLYELDGRRQGPLRRGDTSAETFLADAAHVIQTCFIAKAESVNFSLIALAPKGEE